MEWLQTYKIGKALLDSGNYEPIDAYFESYKIDKENKQIIRAEKTPYILDIVADLRPNATQAVTLDYCVLDDVENTLKKDNFFTSFSGKTINYYLVTPYSNVDYIAKFLGIDLANNKILLDVQKGNKSKDKDKDKNKDKVDGFKNVYEELVKSKLLDEDFKENSLMGFRNLIRQYPKVVEILSMVINNLPKLVEEYKRKNLKEAELLSIAKLPVLTSLFNLSNSGKEQIVYTRLKIITENEPNGIYLNQLPDYRTFCLARFYDLGKIDETKAQNEVCYFSGQQEKVFSINLPRDNVNLLKINSGSVASSSHFIGTNFLVSKNAYDALKLGAWFITKHLTCKIANVPHYIIPDFRGDIDVAGFRHLKEQIDLAFNYSKYKNTTQQVIEKRIGSNTVNSISFIGHHIEAGKAIDIINRIQLVKPNWFNKVFETFDEEKNKINALLNKEWLTNFSLTSTYGIMPIFTDKAKLNNTLFFFKNLLEGIEVETNFLFGNYKNLVRLFRFSKKDNKGNCVGTTNINFYPTDTFDKYDAIGQATIKYQILLNLVNTLFNPNCQTMENTPNNPTETFFAASNYNDAQKALFYLGRLIRRVAIAQKDQGNSKAVLNKITYDGMNLDDIIWLKESS
jgi:CRISPR-associated protein Csh1